MARQIIIIDRRPAAVPGLHALRTALWLPVTVGQELPLITFASAIKGDQQPNGTGEQSALDDGTMVEFSERIIVPSTYSLPNAKTFLEACYTSVSTALNAPGTWGLPGQFYGLSFNGTIWTQP